MAFNCSINLMIKRSSSAKSLCANNSLDRLKMTSRSNSGCESRKQAYHIDQTRHVPPCRECLNFRLSID